MKALFIHAHYDDYEFTAAGTFELWRRKMGEDFRGRVVVCCDGRAGHHFRTRDETARIRLAEQDESAQLGGYEFVPLLLPDGTMPREACLQVSPELLAALWKTIRDFEPDYLFCPPLGSDPLAGIHNDHETVAEEVRRVAYMINVPHAFTPEYPPDKTKSVPCKVPVILKDAVAERLEWRGPTARRSRGGRGKRENKFPRFITRRIGWRLGRMPVNSARHGRAGSVVPSQ